MVDDSVYSIEACSVISVDVVHSCICTVVTMRMLIVVVVDDDDDDDDDGSKQCI